MSGMRARWHFLGYTLAILAIATTLIGCEDKITLPACHLDGGVVSI